VKGVFPLNFKEALLYHAKKYPLMTPQDAVKLAYQDEYGSEHLTADEETVYARLMEELAATPDADAPITTDPVGAGFVRLHLAGTVANGLDPRVVTRLFLRAQPDPINQYGLEQRYQLMLRMCKNKQLPFAYNTLMRYWNGYQRLGCPAVHHSEEYRANYCPAYRLIRAQDAVFLPLLAEIGQRMARQETVCVAIDGPSGAGKSTLAAMLGELYGCPVLHMDDYFVPQWERSEERMSRPGGNVDAARFAREVLPGMTAGTAFTTGVFDCHTQSIREIRSIPASPLYVTEGVYALHPELADAYHIKVYMDVERLTQKRRILRRNGKEIAARYRKEWIPLENSYFETFNIKNQCDFVFEV
jgi:uridine kinase